MFTRSRVRIAMGYVSILALILILFSVVVVIGFWQQASDQQDELLAREAESKKSIVYEDGGDAYADTSDDFGWWAVTPDGRLLARTSTGSALGLPVSGLAERTIRTRRTITATVEGPDGDVRVVSVPAAQSGAVVAVIQVAQSREPVHEAVRRLVFVLLPMGLVALALASVGGLFMSGKAMRPISEAFGKQRAFVADASHELKTPLTLIRIDAEVLARTPRSQDDRELLEHLIAETGRMEAVLSDLLVLARLDTGKLAVARESFNLAEVIVETAHRFGERAAAEGTRLAVEVSERLPVRGDRERTHQILAALLDNALRYTSAGGVVTMAGGSRNGRAEASVKDSGGGIPPEQLSRVFDRFYRAESARASMDGGSGLGLAIARELARAQGGELTVFNADGGGAVFRLSLPAAPQEK
jgi:signal transduction histidine kinase